MAGVIPSNSVKVLCPLLAKILGRIRKNQNFKAQDWVNIRTKQLLKYFSLHKIACAVISVSGGVDSSTVLALLKAAQELASKDPIHPFNPINGGKIVAIAQPIHSTPEIQNRAYEVCESLFPGWEGKLTENKDGGFSFKCITVNHSEEYDRTIEKIERQTGPLNGFAKAMYKSYIRTPTNFLMASNYRGVVMGTGNLDEDGYLYYYCKFGDGAVDVGLIWDLHKSQVFEVAKYLKVPNSVLIAPPSADLAPGQTDEEEIGASYDMVELVYTFNCIMSEAEKAQFLMDISVVPEARAQFDRESNLIQVIHDRGAHKADLNPKNMGSLWFKTMFGEDVN